MTEERSEQLLTSALRTPALSPEGLERVRTAVEREWLAATTMGAVGGSRRSARSSRLRWFAVATAAVVAAVAVTTRFARPPLPESPLGLVSRTDEGELSVLSALLPRRTIAQGGVLRVGDRVTAEGPALVALARGGTLRIFAGTELAVVSASQISLERGLIYVDIPSGTSARSSMRVITKAGAVEHVGTEFEVKSDAEAVRVRVREGRIRFIGTTATVVADAGTELLAVPGKTIVQRPIDTYGGEWLWTAALAPDYEIEGRSLIGFLRWVSRELGRPLNFADANARHIADRTVLHGSVRHQAPIDAMSNVLATTSLTYEIRGDAIWVRSGNSAAL